MEAEAPELPDSRSSSAIQIALDGDILLVGDPSAVVGTGLGAFYSLARAQDRWAYQATVTASDGAMSDAFATSVALDGDTALVGASGTELNGVTDIPGSAYVFVRSGGAWVEQQELTAPDGAIDDHFGDVVALSGDIAVVSAPVKPFEGNENQGALYVFVRSGTTWAFEQKIVAPDGQAREFFGQHIAVDGDTLVAGIQARTVDAGLRQGIAFVFVRSGSAWQLQETLTAADGEPTDAFGGPVAVQGNTAIICAQLADWESFGNHGAGYVFTRAGTTWTLEQKLSTSFSDSSIERFALAVALDGDTALFSAPGYHVRQGGVFAFVRNGATWSEEQELRPSARSMNFGMRVALSGNLAVIGSFDGVYAFERAPSPGLDSSDAGDSGSTPGADADAAALSDASQSNDTPSGDAGDIGGCGCRTARHTGDSSRALLVVGLVCGAVRRRRNRARFLTGTGTSCATPVSG